MQKEFIMESEILSKIHMGMKSAKCEKAETCEWATERCNTAVFTSTMICDPAKRYMYCHAWKQKLGMTFEKDLGIYILRTCPNCNMDLKKHMMKAMKNDV